MRPNSSDRLKPERARTRPDVSKISASLSERSEEQQQDEADIEQQEDIAAIRSERRRTGHRGVGRDTGGEGGNSEHDRSLAAKADPPAPSQDPLQQAYACFQEVAPSKCVSSATHRGGASLNRARTILGRASLLCPIRVSSSAMYCG